MEFLNTIKSFKTNKSPGEDGTLSEFQQIYWNLIKKDTLSVLNVIFENNKLTSSQFKGILTLLYKKGQRARILKIGDL